jgi:hypothetical protein
VKRRQRLTVAAGSITLVGLLLGTYAGEILPFSWLQVGVQRGAGALGSLQPGSAWLGLTTALSLLLGVAAVVGLVAMGAQVLSAFRAAPSGTGGEVDRLERTLERCLILYSEKVDLLGRLRRFLAKPQESDLESFAETVYQVATQYCAAEQPGTQAFLLLLRGRKRWWSTLLEQEVSELVKKNIQHIRGSQQVLRDGTPRLLRRRDELVVAGTGWILPDAQSLLLTPVLAGSKPVGLLGVYHATKQAFTDDVQLVLLEALADLLGAAHAVPVKP